MKVLLHRWRAMARERRLGVELRHHHHGRAHEVRVEREAARRRVIERPRHEVDVGGIGHVERGEPRQELAGIRAAPARALGLPRGAGRIDGGRAEDLPTCQHHRFARARGDEIVEVPRPLTALGADQDPRAHPGRPAPHRLRHGHEGVAHEHGRRLRVVEDVRHLVGREAMVHGNGDGTRRPHCRRGDQHLEAIVRVDDDVLPGRDPEPDERVAEAVPRVAKLDPGQPPIPLDERGPIGLPLRMRRNGVHGPSLGDVPGIGPCSILLVRFYRNVLE